MIDTSQIVEVEVEGFDMLDYPDLSDAFIAKAWTSNRILSETELDILNNDRDFVYEKAIEQIRKEVF